MSNNEPGTVIRYLVNRAKRVPIDLINNYIDLTAPDDSERPPVKNWEEDLRENPPTDKYGAPLPYFSPEVEELKARYKRFDDHENYVLYRLKELYVQHQIIILDSEKKRLPEWDQDEISFIADPLLSEKFPPDEGYLRQNAAAMYAILNGACDDIACIYNLEAPFTYLFTEGYPDGSGDMPMIAYDIACVDAAGFYSVLKLCSMLSNQGAPELTETARKSTAAAEFLAKHTKQVPQEPQNDAGANDGSDGGEDAIEHVAVLMNFIEDYPEDFEDQLRKAGFMHYVVRIPVTYDDGTVDDSWYHCKWFML